MVVTTKLRGTEVAIFLRTVFGEKKEIVTNTGNKLNLGEWIKEIDNPQVEFAYNKYERGFGYVDYRAWDTKSRFGVRGFEIYTVDSRGMKYGSDDLCVGALYLIFSNSYIVTIPEKIDLDKLPIIIKRYSETTLQPSQLDQLVEKIVKEIEKGNIVGICSPSCKEGSELGNIEGVVRVDKNWNVHILTRIYKTEPRYYTNINLSVGFSNI